MENVTKCDSIKLDRDSKELSIELGGELVLGPFDLSSVAVKLAVVKGQDALEVSTETMIGGSFNTENFELKIDLTSDDNKMSLLFGDLDIVKSSDNDGTIDVESRYHAFIIGADDIRNNLIPPQSIFLMERQIVSFQIVNNCLELKYHSAINPD